MMVSVETYLRRGQRSLHRLLLDPRLRAGGRVLAFLGSGFLLSAASLKNSPLPLCLGLICAASGSGAVLICLGAMAGYPFFWGQAGMPGVVWSAAGLALALLLGGQEEAREHPLMIPMIAALLTAATALTFGLVLHRTVSMGVYGLWVALALLSGMLFTQAFACRDPVTDWLVGAVGVLALAQVELPPGLVLGYVAAGLMTVAGAFPEAALAGAALDLAQITPLPMTAVLSVAWLGRMIPFGKTWQRLAVPGGVCLLVMALLRTEDLFAAGGLFLGGALGALAPPRPTPVQRRSASGMAQVRLELGAQVLQSTARLFQELEPPPIDREALTEKVRLRACGSCSARGGCTQKDRITPELLEGPLDAQCRKAGRLIPELRRAQEQLRAMKAQRARQQEYRGAVVQQYRFLGAYLRLLADSLPRRREGTAPGFRVEVSARVWGKDGTGGDRCLAFPGTDLGYFVLLCDGMGTGLGAAREADSAAGLLRQMLTAGFPPEHALGTLNSLLVLRGAAGAVAVDLVHLHLDTGLLTLYKWGAAPSYLMTRGRAEKIGTAAPPPGISLGETQEAVRKLSLRRGEVLVLLSDGVDGEVAQILPELTPDAPPGELAARILERGRGGEDDALVAVIRLRPTGLCTS